MSAWFEDDTLWENLEGLLFSQLRTPEMTVREVEQILALLHPPPGAAVLDLCCGPGRHTLDVHFISSLPVRRQPVCKAWADTRPVRNIWDGS